MGFLNKDFSEKIALISGDGQAATYGDLLTLCESAKAKIAAMLPPQSVVSLIGGYDPFSIATFFALADLKHIVVPVTESSLKELDIRTREAAVEWQADSSLQTVPAFSPTGNAASSSPLYSRLRERNHAGLVLFSSGTTGVPKAMLHDLDHLLSHYEGRRPKPLVTVALLHFDHIGGLNTLLNSLAIGGTLVAPISHDPLHIASLIQAHKVQLLPASPSFLNLLLLGEAHLKFDLASLRLITYGTEPMPASLLARLKAVFPKTKFLQTFGTSETGIARTSSKSSDSVFMRFDDADLEHKVVDGELWIRSKTQILGYLNASMDRFTPDGWFRTGDSVQTDADGFFYIPGRLSQTINVGGLKVEPSEVESVLLEHPNVAACLVFASDSALTGQVVAAEIALKEPLEESAARSALRAHCRSRLESYKVPVKIIIKSELKLSSRLKKPIHSYAL